MEIEPNLPNVECLYGIIVNFLLEKKETMIMGRKPISFSAIFNC